MDVQLQRSLLQPEIGGSIQFSKGAVTFLPQGAMPASDPAPADTADGHQAELISKAFAALQSSKDPQGSGLVRQPSIRIGNPQVCGAAHYTPHASKMMAAKASWHGCLAAAVDISCIQLLTKTLEATGFAL